MSSPSPSSSAVTIPTPGKSILKRPPPPQQSFFSLSRLSKLLPSQNQSQPNASNDEEKALKRAHFILPEMTIVYPILSSNPPSTPSLKEEKKTVEQREAERRRRVVRRNSVTPEVSNQEETWWSLEQVESFYRECCTGREEAPDPGISAAFMHAKGAHPRTVDLSGVQLTIGAASVLSDVFTIEWGLRKLVFKECDLDEHILKPILHSLLIPESLTFLSVASNRRLKAPAYRLIGAYLAKAKSLQFLDLSQNALDKKAIEYIAASLATAPNQGLVSLRLDDCALRPTALDALAHAVRTSSLRNISLRHNKINATGAVALALMIKDYPDRFPTTNGTSSTLTSPTENSTFLSPPSTPASANSPLSSTETLPLSPPPPPPPRSGPVLPPPRHPAAGPQTTYTPYIPRSRRGAAATATTTNPLSPTGKQVPIITSSAQGGVTARHPAPSLNHAPANHSAQGQHHGPSAALLDKVRALQALPRLGALRTLDLRGNDIRNGITYIAQVLKRNRTLKVLNLSENKLDVQALVAIAEALKYNSCLETLDLSKNPCCGPGLEGVQSLRTAFTLNDALKRLFLSSTSLASAGAIALAEFLPESTSLLHLDLTMNNLDLASVMALSSGLKANHTMRCLDLNIPPADEEMARMCRDILNTCVRNTEEAEKNSHSPTADNASGRGQARGVWGMIEESELAKTFRQDDLQKKVEEDSSISSELPASSEDVADQISTEQRDTEVISRAQSCKTELDSILQNSSPSSSSLSAPRSKQKPAVDPELLRRTRESLGSLAALIESTVDVARLTELLALNDALTSLLGRVDTLQSSNPGLHGLGISIDTGVVGNSVAENGNGHSLHPHEQTDGKVDDEDEPLTPRVDKGKRRAEPEPEEPEKVLSPTFLISESDEEDAEGHQQLVVEEGEFEGAVSPTDRSRSWVEEEGEVFRKGTVLLGPEEMEGEFAGEELRKELLEAMVERPPPRAMQDGFIPEDPLHVHESLSSPPPPPQDQQPAKPPPRPYVRRSRSSSSTNSASDSPTVAQDSPLSPLSENTTSSPLSGHQPFRSGSRSSNSSDSIEGAS